MTTTLRTALGAAAVFVIGFCAMVPLSHGAGVYKWRDAQGNLHFSDQPPQGAQAKESVGKVVVQNAYGDFKVQTKTPIQNARPNASAIVGLERLSIRLGASGRNFTAGRAFSGRNCENATELQWDEGIVDLKGKLSKESIAARFRAAGYRLLVADADDSVSTGDLGLEADMVDLKIDTCSSFNSGSRAGSGSRVYIRMRWALKGNGGDSLDAGTSEGAYDGWYNASPVRDSLLKALDQSADNLLAEPAFVDKLSLGHARFAAAPAGAAGEVKVRYGDAGATFRDRSEELLRTAVTVKTARGHGSGVVIDEAGYALTNAHVVGHDDDVQVIMDGQSIPAQVVSRDRRNDVALLRFSADGLKGATLARNSPRPGAPLYVVAPRSACSSATALRKASFPLCAKGKACRSIKRMLR